MTACCQYPRQTISPFSERPEQLLLLCYYDPKGISTVPETVAYMQECSRFSVTVINMFEHRRADNTICLSPQLNIRKFDGIIIHNSLSYNVDNLISLDSLLKLKLKDYYGIKVLMKQDENYRYKDLARYIGQTGFDLIFTCLLSEDINLVYPKDIVGQPKFVRMLTGYVTPTLRKINVSELKRNIDIGYRGSIQPLSFGRLAYEKRKIGNDIYRLCQSKKLVIDISSRWEDRLGSGAWLTFLSKCKSTLGVESGASIFDLNGDLEQRCKIAEQKYGPYQDHDLYAENYLGELRELENQIKYNQISPRHFEAAATRTLQIMYPGSYSGIFKKDRHYIEIKRDYSNFDEVLDVLHDEKRRQQITDIAYDEIINNSDYWIETFVTRFDTEISKLLLKKGSYEKPKYITGRKKKNILLLCAHKPSLDPRLNWIAECIQPSHQITQVGVLPAGSIEADILQDTGNGVIVAEQLVTFSSDMLQGWNSAERRIAGWIGLSEVRHILSALSLDDNLFLEKYNAPANSLRVSAFKWYLRYILNITATLVTQVERMRGYNAIIATDLDSLVSALIIKGMTGVSILYDAHEYWPESDVDSFEFEKQFWIGMEKRLVQFVDHCQTVTPGLAKLMSDQYGKSFAAVPNCEPITSVINDVKRQNNDADGCKFIYQGNFAPMRGIDLLIDAWSNTQTSAILLLRGPDNDYKMQLIDQAKKLGLFNTRIKFVEPVKEEELVSACQDGDVGIIPYTPAGANYSNCCPNKMSQYMAAGLPILANNTNFVKQIVEESRAGIVVDFSNTHNIVDSVNWLVRSKQDRVRMGNNARQYFLNNFNWNIVSAPMYSMLNSVLKDKPVKPLRIYNAKQSLPLYNSGLVRSSIEIFNLQKDSRVIRKIIPLRAKRILKQNSIRIWLKMPQPLRKIIKPIAYWLFERIT